MPEIRRIVGIGALLVVLVAACGGRLADVREDRTLPPPASEAGDHADAASSPDAHDASRPDAATSEGGDAASSCSRFVTAVIDHAFGPGQSHGQSSRFPKALFGAPFAGSASSVVSLGNGGHVTVSFGGTTIVDGPGVDFIVFENPLPGFAELATVAVSEDGVSWTSFPCSWLPGDTDYGSCAGVVPVRSTPLNGVDPTDPHLAGGDGFDLHDIGIPRARFVRITDRADLDGSDGVFDLDAIAIVHAECP
jgi:hypothetical protein